MKNLIYGIVMVLLGLVLTIGIAVINGRTSRDAELTAALGQAVETAVENTIDNDNYNINNTEEFKTDFLQNLLILLADDKNTEKTNADITVDINGIDYNKGLLSVTVTETFKEASKKEKTITYTATVILEKTAADKYYTVQFIGKDDKLLRKYTYVEGTKLQVPKNINMDYGVSVWITPEGQSYTTESLNNLTVDRDLVFKVYQ